MIPIVLKSLAELTSNLINLQIMKKVVFILSAFLNFALVENPSILYEIVTKSKNTLKNEN